MLCLGGSVENSPVKKNHEILTASPYAVSIGLHVETAFGNPQFHIDTTVPYCDLLHDACNDDN